MTQDHLKRIVLTAMLLALCVVGANIKIMGSVAFDSMPAFLGAILLGPFYGTFLGFFGHIVSAALSGFPLSIPVHLVIAVFMGLCMFVFGWIRNRYKTSHRLGITLGADVIGYLINVPLESICLYPIMGPAIWAFFVPLTLATVTNLIVCELIYVALPQRVTSASFLR